MSHRWNFLAQLSKIQKHCPTQKLVTRKQPNQATERSTTKKALITNKMLWSYGSNRHKPNNCKILLSVVTLMTSCAHSMPAHRVALLFI